MRRATHVERTSPLDTSNLRVEEHGLPMHVTALAILDGEPLLDGNGGLRLPDIRARLEERVRGADRLHQVLVWADGPHRRPVWTTAPRFDIADHVLSREVPPPGDEEALLRLCSELNAAPLDRSRPLWQLWLLSGLPDRRVALVVRLHHVVADGLAALELFSSMLDPATESPPAPVVGDVRRSAVRAVSTAALQVAQGWDAIRLGRAPALSWNRPTGPARVHRLVRADLARAKTAAHANGGTVNDLVLAAVAGGARRLLESRGELRPDCDLHVSVAASVRRPGESGGNRVGVRLVAVPVSEPDAAARLRTVAARTARQRNRPPLQPSGRLLQRWTVHVMKRQRMINMIVSNLPGPTAPQSFCGSEVQELFQLAPLQGNCTVGVGVLSYAGHLGFDVVGDPAAVPDLGVFADGVAETVGRLGALPHLVHDG